jgi:hypothetical protein
MKTLATANRALVWCAFFAASMMPPGHAASVADGATGLIWDACAWGQSEGAGATCVGSPAALTWQQALAAAQQANAMLYQSHADWRVPNRTELESTVAIASATTGAGDVSWSSTSYAGDPSRAWTVDFGDGASHPAAKAGAFALRLVRGGELTLSIGDGERYARYGQRADSIAMLANTGGTTVQTPVQFSLSAAFDAGSAQLTCYGAGAGASCTQDAVNPLRFDVVLPPDRSLTWRVNAKVRSDAQDASGMIGASAEGTTPASDTRTLVIFRNTFDTPYAQGTQAIDNATR